MDLDFYLQAIIALVVITAPPDPAKLIFFNSIISKTGKSRAAAALQVAFVVFLVLGGAAVGGEQVANLMGIDLNAFSVVGGIVVAGMGFEMLYGGATSKAQGRDAATAGPDEDSGLIMPLAIPLIAGPGAIVTVVTMSTSNAGTGEVAALIAVLLVAILTFVSFRWFGEILASLSERATALLMRIGGLLLATIGTQMLLGGLKNFFAA